MADRIVDGTKIDTSVLSYSAPKPHASGGKVVNLYNKHFRESLTISTPLMLTWGAQEGKDTQQNPTGKYTLSLQFPSSEYTNDDAEAFLQGMRNLETKIKADAMMLSKEWFGKEIKLAEVIEEKFNVMLRHPKLDKNKPDLDYNKPPTLTVKIPCWNGAWKPEIYNEEGEPLYVNGKVNSHLSPLEFLKPRSHVICLIQCGGLWFVNGKVSITWNLKQAVVQSPKAGLPEGVCFIKTKDSDKERLKSLPHPEDIDNDGPIEAEVVVSSTIVEDSDNEDDVVPTKYTPVPVPPPAPVPEPVVVPAPVVEEPKVVKKRVVAKKTTA
jgi:hypothetical protein